MKLKYYHSLDGLRAIAAIMVFYSHFGHRYFQENEFLILVFGQLQHGVSLFFVLSGFVITRILFQTRKEPGYFRKFYLKRVLRILPLYYLYLVFYYFIFPTLQGGEISTFAEQWPYWVYLQNFDIFVDFKVHGPSHYWSLAVEEHFYLFWPLVIYLVPVTNFKKMLLIGLAAVICIRLVLLSNDFFIGKFTFTRMDQLLLGSLIAYMELKGFFANKKNKKFILISLVVSTVILFLMFFALDRSGYLFETFDHLVLGIVFFSSICFLIFEGQKSNFNKALSLPVVQYLGKISYGLYVWHFSIIFLARYFFYTGNFVIDNIIALSLTILVAHISFKYFESYFLTLKKRL